MHSGTRLGHYEIISCLGVGGMGEVFRARDTRLDRDVAVKVLPKDFAIDADRQHRFEQEAKTLAALNHPNILTIHDAGVHEGAPYLVSELLEGRTLREELTSGALSTRKAKDYAHQVATGLAAAHARGVVHRDLKPENIFVTKDGRVKILDFGLAKLSSESEPADRKSQVDPDAPTLAHSTEPGRIMGTPNYMAPEQVRGESTDQRADLFAFGCVLYEMVSGLRPFRRDTAIATMAAIMNDEPPDLTVGKPDLPPALARIVHRCLEKHPENRFQSANDLAFALETLSDSGVARAWERGMAIRERPVRGPTNRSAWWVGAALAVAVVGMAVYFVVDWQSRPPALAPRETGIVPSGATVTNRHRLAVLPLANLSSDPTQEYFADGMTDLLISQLSRIKSLQVPSFTSVRLYKQTPKQLPEIARELGADTVLEGSIMREGQRVRITARLVHASTDQNLWTDTYERGVENVLALQGEVALAITREIRLQLSPEERATVGRTRPVNAEALDAALRGRFHFLKYNPAGISNAIVHFRKAIELDPSYAPAHCGLADCYGYSAGVLMAPREAWPLARQYVQRALELDDSLADAYAARAMHRFFGDWDWREAEKDLRLALELSPNAAYIHDYYGIVLGNLGRFDEAIAQARQALELERLSPTFKASLAGWYYLKRDYSQAIALAHEGLDIDPDSFNALNVLGWACLVSGRTNEAVQAFERLASQDPDNPIPKAWLACGAVAVGKRSDGIRLMEELDALPQPRYVPPALRALFHAVAGEKDAAIRAIERSINDGDVLVVGIRTDPVFDPLRADPRFQELLGRLKFPP